MRNVFVLALLACAVATLPSAAAAETSLATDADVPDLPGVGVCIPLIGCFVVCTPDGTCIV